MHNGPNIQVYGGVWLLKGYVEVLSHSLPLHFNEFDTEAIEDLLRFMTALRGLFESLCEVYRNPQNHVVDGTQIEFPYPRSYVANVPQDSTSATGKTIQFTYTKRISPIRLVFAARTDGDGEDMTSSSSDLGSTERRLIRWRPQQESRLLSSATLTFLVGFGW